MIPVKICGITNLDDARYAAQSGAVALGFIFHEASPRSVDPSHVRSIVERLPDQVVTVGVFVNRDLDTIMEFMDQASLDMVQLSGSEPADLVASLPFPSIKVFHVGAAFDINLMAATTPDAILLDSKSTGAFGGTGQVFDWSLVQGINRATPMILAGGLKPGNVLAALAAVKADALDLSSGLEIKPGRKDYRKIDQLFSELKHTEATDAQPFRKR